MIQIEHHNDIAILTMDAERIVVIRHSFVLSPPRCIKSRKATQSTHWLPDPATQNSSRMAWILSGALAMAIIQGAIETRLVLSLWG